jgi:hypothetical protein
LAQAAQNPQSGTSIFDDRFWQVAIRSRMAAIARKKAFHISSTTARKFEKMALIVKRLTLEKK